MGPRPWNAGGLLEQQPKIKKTEAEGIDGEEKATGGVCLDGEKNDRKAFRKRSNRKSRAIRWLPRECRSLGG